MAINEFSKPLDQKYDDTYVSQYVRPPFEVYQNKLAQEQARQDEAVSAYSKLGVDQENINYENDAYYRKANEILEDINQKVSSGNGDLRDLMPEIKNASSDLKKWSQTTGYNYKRNFEKKKESDKTLTSEKAGDLDRRSVSMYDADHQFFGGSEANADYGVHKAIGKDNSAKEFTSLASTLKAEGYSTDNQIISEGNKYYITDKDKKTYLSESRAEEAMSSLRNNEEYKARVQRSMEVDVYERTGLGPNAANYVRGLNDEQREQFYMEKGISPDKFEELDKILGEDYSSYENKYFNESLKGIQDATDYTQTETVDKKVFAPGAGEKANKDNGFSLTVSDNSKKTYGTNNNLTSSVVDDNGNTVTKYNKTVEDYYSSRSKNNSKEVLSQFKPPKDEFGKDMSDDKFAFDLRSAFGEDYSDSKHGNDKLLHDIATGKITRDQLLKVKNVLPNTQVDKLIDQAKANLSDDKNMTEFISSKIKSMKGTKEWLSNNSYNLDQFLDVDRRDSSTWDMMNAEGVGVNGSGNYKPDYNIDGTSNGSSVINVAAQDHMLTVKSMFEKAKVSGKYKDFLEEVKTASSLKVTNFTPYKKDGVDFNPWEKHRINALNYAVDLMKDNGSYAENQVNVLDVVLNPTANGKTVGEFIKEGYKKRMTEISNVNDINQISYNSTAEETKVISDAGKGGVFKALTFYNTTTGEKIKEEDAIAGLMKEKNKGLKPGGSGYINESKVREEFYSLNGTGSKPGGVYSFNGGTYDLLPNQANATGPSSKYINSGADSRIYFENRDYMNTYNSVQHDLNRRIEAEIPTSEGSIAPKMVYTVNDEGEFQIEIDKTTVSNAELTEALKNSSGVLNTESSDILTGQDARAMYSAIYDARNSIGKKVGGITITKDNALQFILGKYQKLRNK